MKLNINIDAGTQLDGSIDRSLYYLGVYEIATLDVIRDFLREDSVCIDVGSHNGSMALFAAKVASRGKVLAFEPVKELFNRIRENVELNHLGNVVPINLALGATQTTRTIYVNFNNRGMSSLIKNDAESYAHTQKVRVDTLDNQVKRNKAGRVDIIKIDVEGSELDVLKGARDTITKNKPVLIVEHDPGTESTRQVLDYLNELGFYTIHILQHGRHIRGGLSRIHSFDELPKNRTTNMVCIPRG
jgi:FkbM family methyltransferase